MKIVERTATWRRERRVLKLLRDEDDPLLDLVSRRQLARARPLPAPDP